MRVHTTCVSHWDFPLGILDRVVIERRGRATAYGHVAINGHATKLLRERFVSVDEQVTAGQNCFRTLEVAFSRRRT